MIRWKQPRKSSVDCDNHHYRLLGPFSSLQYCVQTTFKVGIPYAPFHITYQHSAVCYFLPKFSASLLCLFCCPVAAATIGDSTKSAVLLLLMLLLRDSFTDIPLKAWWGGDNVDDATCVGRLLAERPLLELRLLSEDERLSGREGEAEVAAVS